MKNFCALIIFCALLIPFKVKAKSDLSYPPDMIISSYNISAITEGILPRAKLIKKEDKTYTYQLTPVSFMNINTNSQGKSTEVIFIGEVGGDSRTATISALSASTLITSFHPLIEEDRTNVLKKLGISDGKIVDGKERFINYFDIDTKITSILAKNTGIIITITPTK